VPSSAKADDPVDVVLKLTLVSLLDTFGGLRGKIGVDLALVAAA
jgi:hypothetical protein